MSKIKLIVGLGNPGKQYESTRHNAGFWLIDRLAEKYHVALTHKDRFFGQVGSVTIDGNAVHLLKPETFMNLSGKSVQALSAFYRIEPAQIIVAHDELDIGSGEVRLKASGGHGGHNGLRDIVKCIGSKDFYRLRLGINHPGHASQVTGHVLSVAQKPEQAQIESAIERAIDELPKIVNGEFEAAMQVLHSKRA